MRDVTHLVEEKTLVLITATSKITLWSLSLKDREPLSEILPSHLDVLPMQPRGRTDPAAVVRRNTKRAVVVGAAFIVILGFSIPFLKGNPWNRYADSIGKYVLFLCLYLFLLALLQGSIAYALWSYKRTLDKIGRAEKLHGHG
jgi:hypothetical protein